MFKKGQLVRSKDKRRYFMVTENQINHLVVLRTLYGASGILPANEMVLIGNNYQARPKCSR